jgi:ABC-type branched-subunit amino acid transport system permease subunit
MADREERSAQRDEATQGLTGGPGVVATKSQAQGATAGIAIGVIVGAIVGLVIGLLALEGAAITIPVITFAVGGAVAAGVFGGYFKSQKTREDRSTDI